MKRKQKWEEERTENALPTFEPMLTENFVFYFVLFSFFHSFSGEKKTMKKKTKNSILPRVGGESYRRKMNCSWEKIEKKKKTRNEILDLKEMTLTRETLCKI